MRHTLAILQLAAVFLAAPVAAAIAQDSSAAERPVPPLFERETPLAVTLTANLERLRADKDTNAPWRAATIGYQGESGRVLIPARARTRGVWRLKHCSFPPLRLDFAGKDTKGTLFPQLGKPKLVNYCRDTEVHDQYILQEHQLYRVYQLLTPVSYRARLLRVAYVDSASGDTLATRYGIVTEDPDHLARRVSGVTIKQKGATSNDFEHPHLALAYLFQFMIGNTDFSFSGLHNTAIIGTSDGRTLPVAFDFDFAGAVNATYATPDPAMRLRSVRDRRFKGPCGIAPEYVKALPLFHEKKAAIYALYADEIGRLMDPRRVRETLRYFDDFYDMISTPARAQRSFLYACTETG
jgi:hypothetical protein